MLIKEHISEDFLFSTDKERLDIPYIHRFLSEKSYWAKDIPFYLVQRSIANSIAFGIYHQQKQIGFARVITDYTTFGYLADVFIDELYRGKGLSKELMAFIFSIEELRGLRRVMLATLDAHSLYAQFDFKPLRIPERFMEIHKPDVYTALVNS